MLTSTREIKFSLVDISLWASIFVAITGVFTRIASTNVLPKPSLNLLQPNIKEYLLKNYNNYYNENYNLHYAFCKYFWESHVIFPHLDFEEFSKNINKLIS